MKLTGGILGWGGERLGGVHGSLVGYVSQVDEGKHNASLRPVRPGHQVQSKALATEVLVAAESTTTRTR